MNFGTLQVNQQLVLEVPVDGAPAPETVWLKDNAEVNNELADYLQRLHCLLSEGQRVLLPGYTAFMPKSLKRSRAVRTAAMGIITLGCPHGGP